MNASEPPRKHRKTISRDVTFASHTDIFNGFTSSTSLLYLPAEFI
jgi:hypothetical protein